MTPIANGVSLDFIHRLEWMTAMLEETALLAPVFGTRPTGQDLAFSPEFDRIIEYRRADDPTLDQGAWQTDIKAADWNSVLHDCQQLLTQRTKDLRLAGWLVEASTQRDGFPGLASGLRVVSGLCERYWPDLHPMALDGDNDERIGNLTWLLGNALQWVRTLPITAAAQGTFSLAEHEQVHARPLADSGEPMDGPSVAALTAARNETPHAFYRTLLANLVDCTHALIRLQAVIDDRLGLEGPSFTPLMDQLETLSRTVLRFAREAGLIVDEDSTMLRAGPEPATADATAPRASSTIDGAAPTRAAAPGSRREALQRLREVATFFRDTEPHSPVAYLADKAARWGEMPLHVWLLHVIKDQGTLEHVQQLLDIDRQPPQ